MVAKDVHALDLLLLVMHLIVVWPPMVLEVLPQLQGRTGARRRSAAPRRCKLLQVQASLYVMRFFNDESPLITGELGDLNDMTITGAIDRRVNHLHGVVLQGRKESAFVVLVSTTL